jgi:mRNA-degrading endonuclease toxin of MazEF toxin-antitoxin module
VVSPRTHDASEADRAALREAAPAALTPEHPVLVLQRQIGNRATAQLVARAGTTKKTKKHPVVVEGETVIVTSVAEETEAKTIITTIRDTHGIAVDSLKAATATKDAYKNAPKKARDKIKALPWRMKDLRAVKRAVEHYAPILGKARATSKRSKAAQEATTLGKVNTSITEDTKKGRVDPRTLGEFYDTDRAFAIYKSSETNREDFANVEKQIEATTTHELAHGLMYYMINDFMKATGGYWRDEDTKANKKGAEKPPTAYGRKNAREDLCESVMLYFCDEKRLKRKCPKRHAAIDAAVKAWTTPTPTPTPTATPTPTSATAPASTTAAPVTPAWDTEAVAF